MWKLKLTTQIYVYAITISFYVQFLEFYLENAKTFTFLILKINIFK